MKFEHLRQLQERFAKAEEYFDNTVAALTRDMERNPKMSPEEFKHNIAGAISMVAPTSLALDLVAAAVYRSAVRGDSDLAKSFGAVCERSDLGEYGK